jgi:hypothetical protein
LEHNYEPVLCRDDGNCLFNAISISLLGVDATSDLLRAISYVHAMAYIDEIDAWVGLLSLTEQKATERNKRLLNKIINNILFLFIFYSIFKFAFITDIIYL